MQDMELEDDDFDEPELVKFKELRRFNGIVIKSQPFYPGWGMDFGNTFLRFLFWMIAILEIPLYILNLFYFVKWLIGFNDCWAFTVSWLHLIGLTFGCGWVPFAIHLADWERELKVNRKRIYGVYSLGVVLNLVLAPLSVWILSMYSKDSNLIYNEWYTSTEKALKAGTFPRWLTDLGWPESLGIVDCCAWHGPLDMGVTFNFSVLGAGHKLTMGTMDKMSVCYNHLFSTTQKGTLLSFEMKTEMESLPPGCGTFIGADLTNLSYFVFISSVIQCVLTVCMFLCYSYYPLCLMDENPRSSRSSLLRNGGRRDRRKTYPWDSNSAIVLKGPQTSPRGNNNSSPTSLSVSTIVINKRDHLNRKAIKGN